MSLVIARMQEVSRYNFRATHPFRDNWDNGVGHFTQVVWRSTMVMGCGMATKAVPIGAIHGLVGGCKVVVCRYLPAGNVATDAEFRDNGTSLSGKGRETYCLTGTQVPSAADIQILQLNQYCIIVL